MLAKTKVCVRANKNPQSSCSLVGGKSLKTAIKLYPLKESDAYDKGIPPCLKYSTIIRGKKDKVKK